MRKARDQGDNGCREESRDGGEGKESMEGDTVELKGNEVKGTTTREEGRGNGSRKRKNTHTSTHTHTDTYREREREREEEREIKRER